MNIYYHLRTNFWLSLFTLNLRNLLGIGFVIGGLRKVNGHPFANPGQGGAFFDLLDAFHANLIYYEFIGWAQFLAGALLITQRLATIGAVIYFPIILNIAIFTVFSIGSLTPWIASAMCLGNAYLLIWDLPKWINLFSKDNDYQIMSFPSSLPTYDKYWIYNGLFTLIVPSLGFLSPILLGSINRHNDVTTKIFLLAVTLTIAVNLVTNFVSLKKKLKKINP